MIRVLFICHGNICRSPMAELIFKDMVEKAGLSGSFEIASAATSREELGNPVHPGTRRILDSLGISSLGKHAVQSTRRDYAYYDYLIGMDSWNIRNILAVTRRGRFISCWSLPDGQRTWPIRGTREISM